MNVQDGTVTMQQEARSVAVGAGAMLVAKGLQLVLKLVTSLALIRYLGPASYGDYIFALSFSALFGVLSDFGITRLAVRDMSRAPEKASEVLGSSIVARLLLAVLTWIAAQIALLVLGSDWNTHVAVGIASLFYVTEALVSVVAVFQYRLSMQYEALVNIVSQVVDAGLIFVLVLAQASVIQLVATPVIGGIVGIMLASVLAYRKFQMTPTPRWAGIPRLLRDAAPVGIAQIIAITYIRIDGVLLGLLATPHDVGLYGAAFKPVEYVIVAAIVVINPLIPLLARWHDVDRARFASIFRNAAQIQLALMLPVAAVCALLAEPIVVTLYGAEFAESAMALRLLGAAQVLIALNVLQSYTLLAGNHQRVTLLYDSAGLVVNIALNVSLIPVLGFVGAALSALLTAVFISVCGAVATSRLQSVTFSVGQVTRVLASNGVFGLLIYGGELVGLPWLASVLVTGAMYPALLLVFKVVTFDQLRSILSSRSRSLSNRAAVEVR